MDFRNMDLEPLKDFESWEDARQVMRSELSTARADLSDLQRKITQSRVEIDKLANRNTMMTARVQKVQGELQNVSREDIRAAYDGAMETLQRLFVMRGQLEKMESDELSFKRYIELLEGVEQIMEMGMSNEPGSAGSFATVEMMIRAQESERQRLSRQMHDGPAQALANFILQAEIATRFYYMDQDKAREELKILKTAASETFQQVRDFIFQLRPMMLDDLGAIPTVRRYVDAIKNQHGAEINVIVTGTERRLESYLEVIIFRSIQELIATALTQSQANEINVQLDLADHEIRISVEDNGRGVNPEDIEAEEFVGVKLIKERAEMLGGYFEVDSAVGQGTRITFRVPVVKVGEIV